MELKDNPLLQPEDYMSGYNESIEELKNKPEAVAFDKMCYELFGASEMGKKFMQHVERSYLIPSLVQRGDANYQIMLLWADGFKDAFRLIKQCVMSHEQRIKHEGNK
jgi:hypothetical protein